jgi:hypothetical protein
MPQPNGQHHSPYSAISPSIKHHSARVSATSAWTSPARGVSDMQMVLYLLALMGGTRYACQIPIPWQLHQFGVLVLPAEGTDEGKSRSLDQPLRLYASKIPLLI